MWVEITKEAFRQLVGVNPESKEGVGLNASNDLAEKLIFNAFECRLMQVTNFVGGIVQYYIEDINA